MLTASEAKAITSISSSANPLSASFVIKTLQEIEKAAIDGKSSITSQLGTGHNKKWIIKEFQRLGYQIHIDENTHSPFVTKIRWGD